VRWPACRFADEPGRAVREFLLRGPEADTARLTVKGRASLQYPQSYKFLPIADPGGSVGKSMKYEDLDVRLCAFERREGTLRVLIQVSQPDLKSGRDFRLDGIQVRPKQSGKPLRLVERSAIDNGGMTAIINLLFTGDVDTVTGLDVGFVDEVFNDSFEFELKDIRLPK